MHDLELGCVLGCVGDAGDHGTKQRKMALLHQPRVASGKELYYRRTDSGGVQVVECRGQTVRHWVQVPLWKKEKEAEKSTPSRSVCVCVWGVGVAARVSNTPAAPSALSSAES